MATEAAYLVIAGISARDAHNFRLLHTIQGKLSKPDHDLRMDLFEGPLGSRYLDPLNKHAHMAAQEFERTDAGAVRLCG